MNEDIPPIFRGNESSNPVTMPTKENDINAIISAVSNSNFTNEHKKRLLEIVVMIPKYEWALWRCVQLSGEDTSGGVPTFPTLDVYAVREVERLREECDEFGKYIDRRIKDMTNI